MNSENHQINGETLKYYRKDRGYSQAVLADKMQVDANSISRWEVGTNKVTQDNQSKLADTLGISLECLRKPLPSYKVGITEELDPRIKSTISETAKVALDIVSETYHINRNAIMDIAPFMFHALAAASLGKRAIKLDEMDKEIKKFQEFSMQKLPYIPGGLSIDKSMGGGSLLEEHKAINNNKLFFSDEHCIPDDINDISTNPFSQFLESFIDLMPEKLAGLFEVEWRNDELPRYKITDSYIREILRVPVDDALLEKIMELILNGHMQLNEIDNRGFFSDEFIEEHKERIFNEIKEKVTEKHTAYQTSKQPTIGENV